MSLNFQFHDEVHTGQLTSGQSPCLGDAFFTMKTVPEYVTWTGAADNGNSNNWNNDANWTRSTKGELYKEDYHDYGADGAFSALAQQQTYVPMKFTKVTVPAYVQAPYLARPTYYGNGIIQQESLTNADAFTPTDGIQARHDGESRRRTFRQAGVRLREVLCQHVRPDIL